jgi:hypothetical protein
LEQKITIAAESVFFLVQNLRDLSNLKKQDNEGTNLAL